MATPVSLDNYSDFLEPSAGSVHGEALHREGFAAAVTATAAASCYDSLGVDFF